MHGGIRIALPYAASFSEKSRVRASGSTRRLVSSFRSIFVDLLLLWDFLAIVSCGIACAALLDIFHVDASAAALTPRHLCDDLIRTSVIGGLLTPIIMRERAIRRPDAAVFGFLVKRALALVGFVLIVALATRLITTVPALWVAGWFAAVVGMSFVGRVLAAAALQWTAQRFGGERVAVVGAGAEADWLRTTLRHARSAGVDLVPTGRNSRNLDVVVADLVARGRRGELDRVVLALPGLPNEETRRIAHGLKALQIEVASLFPLLGAGRLQHTTDLADIPLFLVSRRPQWGYGGLSKRVMDYCFALGLLLWTAPLLLLIALAIRLDSPGPVLFRQRRHGVNGSEFMIYKFRTMVWQGQVAGNGAVQTSRGDRRVTRIGAFLRSSSLDEVPQLLNVLNGTMSLVGPRPHPTVMRTEERSCDEITPDYPHRHRVKPGITGWAQINGLRGATETAEQLRQRIEHDNFYIENWSPWFDLRILAMTPASLLFRRNNAY